MERQTEAEEEVEGGTGEREERKAGNYGGMKGMERNRKKDTSMEGKRGREEGREV